MLKKRNGEYILSKITLDKHSIEVEKQIRRSKQFQQDILSL